MGKVAQKSAKYVIEASLKASGVVEKPDIVGAIFGQTEGLLGEELDLRELQEKGRIGRIHVEVEGHAGTSKAQITIPSSLDATDTALIGAALETIERVGPSNADIKVEEIRDERVSKRDYIRDRAKELLEDINSDSPEHNQITQEVKEEVRTAEIVEYEGFEAGPNTEYSDEIIIVEGRADLTNLLSYGVKNGLAIGGTSIPDKVSEVVADKEVTVFLDGDRGGDLILKELDQKCDVDNVTRAPENKEVEELGQEEVHKCLRDKEPVKFVEIKKIPGELTEEERKEFARHMENLVGTRAVYVLDEELGVERRFPLDNHDFELRKAEDTYAVLLDGQIDNQIVREAENNDANYIVGMSRKESISSSSIKIMTRKELKQIVA